MQREERVHHTNYAVSSLQPSHEPSSYLTLTSQSPDHGYSTQELKARYEMGMNRNYLGPGIDPSRLVIYSSAWLDWFD